jgi:hypothetical protein
MVGVQEERVFEAATIAGQAEERHCLGVIAS